MIDSQTLDEIEQRYKLSPKVGPFAPKVFNTEIEQLISEIRKLQERDAALRATLINVSLGHEKCFGQSISSAWTPEQLAREVLALYPEAKEEKSE